MSAAECMARDRGEDCGICDWLVSAQGEQVAIESGPFDVEAPSPPVVPLPTSFIPGPPLPEPIPGYVHSQRHVIDGEHFVLGAIGPASISGPLVDKAIAEALVEKGRQLRALATSTRARNPEDTIAMRAATIYVCAAELVEGGAAPAPDLARENEVAIATFAMAKRDELLGLAANQERNASTMRVCGYPADALLCDRAAATYRRAADIIAFVGDTEPPPPATKPSGP